MSTLHEELELERLAVEELRAETNALWQAGHFGMAQEAKQRLREAEAHVAALEKETA